MYGTRKIYTKQVTQTKKNKYRKVFDIWGS